MPHEWIRTSARHTVFRVGTEKNQAKWPSRRSCRVWSGMVAPSATTGSRLTRCATFGVLSVCLTCSKTCRHPRRWVCSCLREAATCPRTKQIFPDCRKAPYICTTLGCGPHCRLRVARVVTVDLPESMARRSVIARTHRYRISRISESDPVSFRSLASLTATAAHWSRESVLNVRIRRSDSRCAMAKVVRSGHLAAREVWWRTRLRSHRMISWSNLYGWQAPRGRNCRC
eukprot:SAG31_NODE_3404_length_4312_cov_3.365773_4_plen_229_part_00